MRSTRAPPRPASLRHQTRHERHGLSSSMEASSAHIMDVVCPLHVVVIWFRHTHKHDALCPSREVRSLPDPRGVCQTVSNPPKIWRNAQDARWLQPFNPTKRGHNRAPAFRRLAEVIALFSDSTVVCSGFEFPIHRCNLQSRKNRSSLFMLGLIKE